LAFKTYTLRFQQSGVTIPNISGSLRLDEPNGIAILDLGDATLSQLLAAGADADAAAALVNGLPTEDPEDGITIWNNAGTPEVASPA
jgi:hypothetical protein